MPFRCPISLNFLFQFSFDKFQWMVGVADKLIWQILAGNLIKVAYYGGGWRTIILHEAPTIGDIIS